MISALLSAAVLVIAPGPADTASQTPLSQTPPPSIAPVDLEDVVVEGNRLENATQAFVRAVGAPARGRGLARWRGGICAGVANLQPEPAQFIVDRISDTARDLGLRVGQPDCVPTILVVATKNAAEFTPAFVERRPSLFRVGGPGMDRGSSAFENFKTSDRAVRWWQVSVSVDELGGVAVRIPGYCANACINAADMTPGVRVLASRLLAPTEDDIKRVFVIVDVDKVADTSIDQLADYISMVALAQVDPEADTRSYSTILNVFNDPQDTPRLTTWDRAYLRGLYEAQRSLRNTRAARHEVASSIIRARRDMETLPGETQAD
jgi:hypothetical protein